tara:strand:+ start:965 stop:1267 length:303 start_codon:yes stop_codon:yes gene_type:complete
MRYKARKLYNPTTEDVKNFQWCVKNRIAYVPEAYEHRKFWIKRLYLDDDLTSGKDKRDSYLRIDKSKTDTRKNNRQIFNEFEVFEEIFRLYKVTRQSLNK